LSVYNLGVTSQLVPDRELLVAIFVRARRKTARLTQLQLGELAGVGKRFVVELEQGKPTLRMDKVNQVLAVFGRQLGPVAPGQPERLRSGMPNPAALPGGPQ
jgi:y4mF family transcriptional regulator